jgi:IclR family transcriptional regulator, KDG regulon repressor
MNPLHKIFSVLETVVACQSEGATYSAIIKKSNLPKSTVHRILKDLTQLGYLTFASETKRYFGSLKLAALGAEVMTHFRLSSHVHPYLLKLNQETGHTANLGICNGTIGVFADKVQSKDFGIRLFSEIGKAFPLHCTGLGKVLLAYSAGDVFQTLVSQPLEAYTELTITDRDRLRAELKSIRENGYALDNEEITRGIKCVAAPIFGHNQEFLGAISIAFLAALENERSIDKEISATLRYASLISESLGNKGVLVQVNG